MQPATAQESSTYECYGTSRPVSTLEEAQKNIGKWVCSIPPGSGNIPRNARIKYAEDIYGQITYVIVYDDNGMEDRAAANSVRFIGE